MAPTQLDTVHLTFTAPPPGFAPVVDFTLSAVDGADGLFTLRDSEGADLRLFLVDPGVFVPDYAPKLAEEHYTPLGAESSEQVDTLVVATMTDTGPVVNLFAPILVNPATNAAAQVILDGTDWPIRAQLVAP
ncbi:flagellar assembly protein FliW [Naasia sp. SYSU D00948]|uniref:flagellar assembly protein FliW n=1 Tax=Naasia sp. SYSU D00948 TaxID=2817379 RepID=UPI001B30B5E2|nr:flagellar assembly protein FliW [Naasia sp. SYSU D00948]